MEVLESELITPIAAANAGLRSALAPHPDVDINKMSGRLTELSYDLFSTIPYLTRGGGSTASRINTEREEAVQQFKEWQTEEAKKKALSVSENSSVGNE